MRTILTPLMILAMMLTAGCKEEPGGDKSNGSAKGQDARVDDSTAEAAVDSYVALMNNKQRAEAIELVVPGQRDPMQKMLDAMHPATEALETLRDKVDKKWPGNDIDLTTFKQGGQTLSRGAFENPKYEVVSVETTGETEGKAVVRQEGSDQPQEFDLKRLDGQWRISDPRMDDPQQVEQGVQMMKAIFGGLAEAYDSAIDRLDAGEFKSPEELKSFLTKAVLKQPPGMPEMPEMPKDMPEGAPAIPAPPRP